MDKMIEAHFVWTLDYAEDLVLAYQLLGVKARISAKLSGYYILIPTSDQKLAAEATKIVKNH
jgi:hypothetical protein